MSRRTRMGLIAAVAAVVAVVGVILAVVVLNAPRDPRAAAERYLSVLAAGDTEALAGMTGSFDDAAALEAFAGAAAYLEDPRVVDIRIGSDGFAAVDARVVLDGRERQLQFLLVRSGDDWTLGGEFLGVATITATFGAPVRVGGTVVAPGDVALFPAVYDVTAAPDVLTGGTTVAVTTARQDVTVDLALLPEAAGLVQPQIDAYAQACAEGGSRIPPQCGIRIPWAADLARMDAVAFRVERTPQVALSDDARSFAATGGVLVATVSGLTRTGEAASVTYRDEDWSLRGSVSFDGEDTVLGVH